MRKRPRPLFLFVTLIATTSIAAQQYSDTLTTQQVLFSNASRKDISCFRIPSLVTATNGDLIAAIDERVPSCGDLNRNNDINIVIRRSQDNGTTWTNTQTIVDFPLGISASDPSMIVDRVTNEIFMFYNYMDLNQEQGIYYLHMIKSTDHGQSWSEPTDLTAQISKPDWHHDFKFITSGRGIQTQSGKLLHCLVNLDHGMHLFASDNHGENWYLIDTPIKPADESKIVELADGTWMINSRVNKQGVRFAHTSTDQGKTWTTIPQPQLIDPGCNASFIRYTTVKDGFEKNRLLFSNPKSATERQNLTVRLSYDEGKTWSVGKTLYAGSSAYSTLTILDDGDIGLLFEKDNYTKHLFIRFSLQWLTEGQDQYVPTRDR